MMHPEYTEVGVEYRADEQQSLILKSLGFNARSSVIWKGNKPILAIEINEINDNLCISNSSLKEQDQATAPLYKDVIGWLKREKDIQIDIDLNRYTSEIKTPSGQTIWNYSNRYQTIKTIVILESVIIDMSLKYLTIDKNFTRIK